MKFLTALLLLFTVSGHSQSLKEKLKGTWLCTKVIAISGDSVIGAWGTSDKYLRFKLTKEDITITKSPFDRGNVIPIIFRRNGFIFEKELPYKTPTPETFFDVERVSEDTLVLSTMSKYHRTIYYHFISQEKFERSFTKKTNDYTKVSLVIRHVMSEPGGKLIGKSADSYIPNDSSIYYPSPIFTGWSTLGQYLANNVAFTPGFEFETYSDEIVVEFEVKEEEIGEIKVLEGSESEMAPSLVEAIKKTSKKWAPLVINKETIPDKVRLHVTFYMGQGAYISGDLNNINRTGNKIIRLPVDINAPIEKIWDVLVKSTFVKQWISSVENLPVDELSMGTTLKLGTTSFTVTDVLKPRVLKFLIESPDFGSREITLSCSLSTQEGKSVLFIALGDFTNMNNEDQLYSDAKEFVQVIAETIKALAEQ